MTSFEHELMTTMTVMVATNAMQNVAEVLAGVCIAMDDTKEECLKTIGDGILLG